MSLRDGPFGEIKPPLIWLAVAALVVALIAGLYLFVAGGEKRGPLAGLGRSADDLTAPVGKVLSTPIAAANQGLGIVGAYVLAGSQNQQLRADLAAALSWRDETLKLRQENARLRALLGLRTEPPIAMVAARTVLDARGPFSNSRLADAGSDQGVIEGNPALSEHGLVGRIAGVGPQVSRIMLLTDVESRVPVMIARTNGRAILTGDGGPDPSLAYLRTHDPLHTGDRIITSGDGGVVPRGLAVGAAVKGADGVWRVILDADAAPIDFVRILLFKDFAQLARPATLAPTTLPTTATEAPEPAVNAVVPPTHTAP
ncbi:MAG TPA: rod shape-determining protein MreC [Caulobacteraceae bacterium]|nr:rod shape-determining protein MreC [Caulobacteraceae bacterium]